MTTKEKLILQIAQLIIKAENQGEVKRGLTYYLSPDVSATKEEGMFKGNNWYRQIPSRVDPDSGWDIIE